MGREVDVEFSEHDAASAHTVRRDRPSDLYVDAMRIDRLSVDAMRVLHVSRVTLVFQV